MKFVFLLIILNVILLAVYLKGSVQIPNQNSIQKPEFPEAQDLVGKNLTFEELKKYFTDLAEKRSAKYAYDVLKKAPVPPNTDMHLLGHVVGDILYRQEGAEGMKVCTEDFRNACSHSIVVGFFTDKGEEALPEITQACKQAPGGSGAYTMCFHGLGHGILAYVGFELPKAIDICKKIGGSTESSQCISGIVMEIISGGGHDKALWANVRKKYLFANNPFYPCAAEFMPNEAKQLCYTYITPYLWEAIGADTGQPTPQDFEKSFALCNQIPDKTYVNTCFGGFGKEFVGLAASRDIRRVDQMSDEQLAQVYNWCQLAKNKEGIQACLQQALASLYWGGENDWGASIRFCNIIPDPQFQKNCFTDLIGQVSSYINDPEYRKSFCRELPDEFQSQCRSKLIL